MKHNNKKQAILSLEVQVDQIQLFSPLQAQKADMNLYQIDLWFQKLSEPSNHVQERRQSRLLFVFGLYGASARGQASSVVTNATSRSQVSSGGLVLQTIVLTIRARTTIKSQIPRHFHTSRHERWCRRRQWRYWTPRTLCLNAARPIRKRRPTGEHGSLMSSAGVSWWLGSEKRFFVMWCQLWWVCLCLKKQLDKSWGEVKTISARNWMDVYL